MDCCYEKCALGNKNDNSLRFVSCWLCTNFAHIKCAAIPGSTIDKIEQNLGLNWSCWKCRKLTLNFSRIVRTTRNAFNNLKYDFNLLSKKFEESDRVINNLNFDEFSVETNDVGTNTIQEVIPTIAVSTEIDSCTGATTEKTAFGINFDVSSRSYDLIELTSPKPPATEHDSSSTVAVTSASASICPGEKEQPGLSCLPSTSGVQAPCKNIHSTPRQTTLNRDAVPTPSNLRRSNDNPNLRVVLPKKAIFISRLAADTTESDLIDYIAFKLKCSADPNISVQKFNFNSPREIASFKIIVPDDAIFERMLSQDFWPKHTVMHEYIRKKRTRPAPVVLDRNAASKN